MILANHGIVSSSGGLPPSTLLTNLYAVYKAENNANDSLGIYNGTAQGGLTYTAGKSGNAFLGNNVNGYIALPTNSINFNGTSFSVNAWVNFDSNTHNEIANSYYWAGSGNEYGWYLRHYLGNIEASFVNGTNTRKISYSYAGLYNSWNMITMTKTFNGNMSLYVNGILVGTYTTTENPSITTSHFCSIGVLKWLGSEIGILKTNCKIDEIGFWNKTLTITEITELQTKFYPY